MSRYRVFYLLNDDTIKHQKVTAENLENAKEVFLLNNPNIDAEIIGVEEL